jgi:hypothetical protein
MHSKEITPSPLFNSYSERIIHYFPSPLQKIVVQINERMKQFSWPIIIISIGAGSALYVFSAVPATPLIGALAAGIIVSKLATSFKSLTPGQEDLAWLSAAAIVANFVANWPISLVAGITSTLIAFNKFLSSSNQLKPADQRTSDPIRETHQKLNQALRDLIGVQSRYKAKSAQELEKLLLKQKSVVEAKPSDKAKYLEAINEYLITYEALVRTYTRPNCDRMSEDIFNFFKEHNLIEFAKQLHVDESQLRYLYCPPLANSCFFCDTMVLVMHSSNNFGPREDIRFVEDIACLNENDEAKPTRDAYSDGYYYEPPFYTSYYRKNHGETKITNDTKESILVIQIGDEPRLTLEASKSSILEDTKFVIIQYKILGKPA